MTTQRVMALTQSSDLNQFRPRVLLARFSSGRTLCVTLPQACDLLPSLSQRDLWPFTQVTGHWRKGIMQIWGEFHTVQWFYISTSPMEPKVQLRFRIQSGDLRKEGGKWSLNPQCLRVCLQRLIGSVQVSRWVQWVYKAPQVVNFPVLECAVSLDNMEEQILLAGFPT